MLVLIGDPVTKFDQTWIWLSIVLFVTAFSVSNLLLLPRVNRLIAPQRELIVSPPSTAGPPPQVAEMERLGGQVPKVAVALQVILIMILT